MLYIFFVFIIILLAYLGLLVFFKNPKGRDNKNFLIAVLLSGGWLILNFFENIEAFGPFRKFLLKADFIIAPIVAYFWLIFFMDFLERESGKLLKKAILFSPLLVIPFLVYQNLVIDKISYNSILFFELGDYFWFYSFWVIVYFILANYYLLSKIRHSQGVQKKQAKLILIGFFVSSFLLTITSLFFQNKINTSLYRVSSFSIIFLILFTAYAILKYKLFDIKFIIQKSIIYAGSLATIISLYIILIGFFGIFVDRNINLVIHFSSAITIILGIYGVPYLEKFFQKITDSFFFKDKYNFTDALNSVSEILNKNIKLESLLRLFSLKLKQILKTKTLSVVLLEEKSILDDNGIFRKINSSIDIDLVKTISGIEGDYLSVGEIKEILISEENKTNNALHYAFTIINKLNVDFIVKIKANNKLLGYILLGEKKSGYIFDKEDRALLKAVSLQAGVAIEKARLYKQVQEYSEDLEKKVKKRTARIERLQQQQKQMMLEIAHRLQTPLTIIKGDLSVLQKKMKNNKNLEKFENSINKLSKFIYDILKLARLENSSQVIEMEKTNLSQIVYDLGEYFGLIMNEKKIKFKVLAEKDIYIKGNDQKLEELITNLVSNSSKYIGDKKNKKISLILKRLNNKRAVLIIEDNGMGIEKSDLKKLFTNFYRSKNVNNTSIEGTGLGLVITKKIVDVHEAKIKLNSILGKGTKIEVEFKMI